MNATIEPNLIPIQYSYREDDNSHWLTIKIDGWDDCKKLVKKVLTFEGRKYTWMSWNSDRNTCHFKSTNQFAAISNK